ncbi:hypothetical protein [Gaoshiqia sediminis]|uniref:Uncharacterized protein n=1 Tax=Gaoshiqia sediminis TaxID=2986998 RepID=A0AA41YBF5_9BACT|nr:hypothetical protein [Gaoshiqia sediminis]MCW0484648.1 hypothetical protein [Gaoshiqia sediminis]
MALPETGITVTHVKNVLSESLTGVAALNLSENANPWGFNSIFRG